MGVVLSNLESWARSEAPSAHAWGLGRSLSALKRTVFAADCSCAPVENSENTEKVSGEGEAGEPTPAPPRSALAAQACFWLWPVLLSLSVSRETCHPVSLSPSFTKLGFFAGHGVLKASPYLTVIALGLRDPPGDCGETGKGAAGPTAAEFQEPGAPRWIHFANRNHDPRPARCWAFSLLLEDLQFRAKRLTLESLAPRLF